MEVKMLRKIGTEQVFPFTDILFARGDMEVFFVSPPTKENFKTKPTEKPGAGWVRNHLGTWTRRKR